MCRSYSSKCPLISGASFLILVLLEVVDSFRQSIRFIRCCDHLFLSTAYLMPGGSGISGEKSSHGGIILQNRESVASIPWSESLKFFLG